MRNSTPGPFSSERAREGEKAVKEELAAKHMGYLLLRAREGEDEFVTIKCIACDNMKVWKTLL